MTDPRPLQILLVDDDQDDNFVHCRIIARSGLSAQVTECASVDEAIAYLRCAPVPPDIILLDVNMPRKSGWEFLEEFGTLAPEATQGTSIFMLTSSSHAADRSRANRFAVVRDYLLKPLTKEALERVQALHSRNP